MISIIVTVYNINSKYLKRCLNSLKNQTNQNIEILIIDDGSTDNSRKICDEYISKNTKVYHRKHLGVSEARNFGIIESTGEWIAFIDGDDFIENNMVDILYEAIENQKYADIYIFSAYINYKNKQVYNNFFYKKSICINKDDLIMQMISKNYCNYYPEDTDVSVPWAKLYNRKFIIDSKLSFVVGMKRMQDMIFNLYAFQNAKVINYYDVPFYHHIKNSESVVNKYSDRTIIRYEKMFDETKKFLNKYKKDKKFDNALNLKKQLSLIIYAETYFFNKNNHKKYKQIKKEFIELLNSNYYNCKIDYSKLNFHQEILIFLTKHKMIFLAKQIINIKKTLKNKKIY